MDHHAVSSLLQGVGAGTLAAIRASGASQAAVAVAIVQVAITHAGEGCSCTAATVDAAREALVVTPVAAIVGKTGRASIKAAAIASVGNNATGTSRKGAAAFTRNLTPLAGGLRGLIDASGASGEIRARALALGIACSQRGTNVLNVIPGTIFNCKALSAAGRVLGARRTCTNLPSSQALSSSSGS